MDVLQDKDNTGATAISESLTNAVSTMCAKQHIKQLLRFFFFWKGMTIKSH